MSCNPSAAIGSLPSDTFTPYGLFRTSDSLSDYLAVRFIVTQLEKSQLISG
ncbi:hypothetical protein JCM19239_4385 [Vibrio variabilis]|uniref:Uncharacterized protein n=1 Tax=Vibrio variabilis TaxID=990271 RepID=A0ABQ0JE50_9VIBR|nr:hypothetical protein JCM19239_4385 [Vibrio variabilis]